MTYAQITLQERYALMLLRRQGKSLRAIARELHRAPSTISRELRRNRWRCDPRFYWYLRAQSYTNRRRRISRRNAQYTAADWAVVERFLRQDWSPEQVVGWCARFGLLAISHETTVGGASRGSGTSASGRCYFATPHHAWERGTNENTNGLIRQYLKKRTSMEHLTTADCQRIADKLNTRPRKRLGYARNGEAVIASGIKELAKFIRP